MLRLCNVLTAVVLLANCYALSATAQVSKAVPSSTISQRNVGLAPAPISTPKSTTVRRQISKPGVESTPVSKAPIRLNPIQLSNLAGRPFMANTVEGQLLYVYDENDEYLVAEHVGTGPNMIVGHYTYDRHGQFEKLTYSDGVTITATYNAKGKLAKLTSEAGRSIGFHYYENDAGETDQVTPTKNSLAFHSAVALLRLKDQPYWWPASAPPMEHLLQSDGDGGKATPSGSGWEQEYPQYPHDPFPGSPKTPDGISQIPISAPAPMPSKLPPPFVQPVYNDGIQIIPTGSGPGRSPSPGIIAGEFGGMRDLETDMKAQARCHNQCTIIRADINKRCKTGPTWADKDECWEKMDNFMYHCETACDTKDYQLDFYKAWTPEQKNFAPWERSWKPKI